MCNDPNNAALSRPFPVLSRLNAVAATVPQTGVCRACLSGLHADADAIACKAAQLLPVRGAFMRSGCGAQHVTGPTPTGPPGARGAQPSAGLPALADGPGPRATRALACRGAGFRAGHRTACRTGLRPGGGACADQVRPRGRGRAARTSHARRCTRSRRWAIRWSRTRCWPWAAPTRRCNAWASCRRRSRPTIPHLMSKAMALQRARAMPRPCRLPQALALKMDDALLHFHLGTSFRQLGMKAEAAECVRTAVTLGLGCSELAARGQLVFLEREACRWPEAARPSWRACARRCAPCPRARRWRPAPSRMSCSSTTRSNSSRWRSTTHCTWRHCGRCRACAPATMAAACAWAISRPISTPMPRASCWCRCWRRTIASASRSSPVLTGPDDGSALRQPRRGGGRALRGAARPGPRTCGPARPRTRHRHPGGPQGRHLRHAAAGVRGAAGAAAGHLAGFSRHHRRALHRLPDRRPGGHAAGRMPRTTAKRSRRCRCATSPTTPRRERPLPSRRADWGVPEEALLLCAFHQSYKISPEVFDVWCSLLEHVPMRCCGCCSGTPTSWTRCAPPPARAASTNTAGVCADRALQQHLSRLACADIYLDAWPCNAHTTAGEALWVGVPVVTLAGRTFAQRVAASLLHAVRSGRAGVPRRRRLSRQGAGTGGGCAAPRRAEGRTWPGSSGSARCSTAQRFARDLEALLQRMWQRAVRGHAPQHLAAEGAA